jgi:uncharacterized membrane protein YidH (DUF202 family)
MTQDNRISDHLANERTFLAWIRTSLGIIAFGFVIEKFGLFMKQMGLIVGKSNVQNLSPSQGYSEIIGILTVGFGTVIGLLAYINFKKTEKHILQGASAYRPSGSIYAVLIFAIMTMGIFLLMYLIQNIQ